ncbi:hypothetical protein SBY92_001406 [Candida maltosa Xu316]|uniref:HRQ family protein n=1 Tax=Candida maltosa (strain Xu316) TaxID=1245528 RepID=M3HST0_CANMX|nr:hypothetical protein G210_2065 [Candida maltosa Xu316]
MILIAVIVTVIVASVYGLSKVFTKKHDSVINNIKSVAPDFNWKVQEPLPIRPFVNKKNFNPSMGVKNIGSTPEDWLLIENTYLTNINLRVKTFEAVPEQTSFVNNNPMTESALREFYDILTIFLVQRYPMIFKRSWGGEITNMVTNETFPSKSDKLSNTQIMKLISSNIEEDFLIMHKDNPDDQSEEYILRASLNSFPAGFDPRVNFNQPVSFIHKPVPQYKSRLQFTMGKFFNNLKSKDMWVRHNWSIQTHSSMYNAGSNHGREGEKIQALKMEDIDFENGCFLRCERQVFIRLPKSHAILMTIRTYLTPIDKIKEEGNAMELIRGIDSLPDDLAFYKRRDAWGEAVKEYLRS